MNSQDVQPLRSIAIISNNAHSLANFRGPLIRALTDAGVQVWALAPDYDADTRAAVQGFGAEPIDISLDRAGMKPIRDALDVVRLARVLRRLQPDASLAYFIKPVIYGSLAAFLAGVPRRFALVEGMGYVFTPSDDGKESTKRHLLRQIVSRMYQTAFAVCERVVFLNADDREQLVGARLLPRAKAELLDGIGVDLTQFAAADAVTSPIRFLLIARLIREKGVAEFADAARLLKARYPDAEFHLAGGEDPNPGGFSAERARQWERDGILIWHGHVADVRPLIARCSVYVLPSYREGKPRSTQEAMAMAKPVVTTTAVGCKDTVEEGVNGFKVPVRDAAALADAMARFIDQPDLIPTMGAASRRMAEERYDVNKINARILGILGIGASEAGRDR